MTFAVDKWKKNGWKIALWSMLGLLAIRFAIWPLLQSAYLKASSVGQAKKESETGLWNDFLAAWPYTTVALGAMLLFAIVIVVGLRDGKTAGERTKKTLEFCWALGKVLGMLAAVCVLTVFIIGPTKFWGQPMVIQQVPAQGTTRGITTQAGASGDPKRIDILAPVGTLATPLNAWGGPLHLNGRRSQMDAFSDDGTRREGVLAVNADGVIHIIGPGLDPDIGKPNTLWFLSLTNFPLKVSGRVE